MPLLWLGSIFDQLIAVNKVATLQELTVHLICCKNEDINKNDVFKKLTILKAKFFPNKKIPIQNPLADPLYVAFSLLVYQPLLKALYATPKAFASFLTISVMITTGITNAGFIILLATGAAQLGAVTFGLGLVLGIAFAVPGGIFSGYAQKNIYEESLEGFIDMIMDGTFVKIAKENPGLFALATFCALCSFLVNLGIGLMGMGVFFASGGAPVIILSVLFALANAVLVYYTALDQINKGNVSTFQKIIDLIKPTLLMGLTILFGAIATFGLVMTFFPGATEITKKFEHLAGQIAFGALLFFAVLTEVFYSWVKSSHLAANVCGVLNTLSISDEGKGKLASALINASVNCALGAEGGVEFAEKVHIPENDAEKNIGMQTGAAVASFGWSGTCSATQPPEKFTRNTMICQFNTFINKNNVSNPAFDGTVSNQYTSQPS